MPAKRLSMRKIKEILRLTWSSGLSNRQIARSCALARSTVAEYLRRAQAAGLSWPLPAEWDDVRLEELLFPPAAYIPAAAVSCQCQRPPVLPLMKKEKLCLPI